ncbi:MAG: carboxypeptidase regulatory-like domain-containing protein [Bryobacterales bacterium]|nr:carboxypeptidase regulatory-like domain-containing protein [Bryobacterales bacterium]
MQGTVSDSSGAVVPGAKVSVENQATGASRSVETDAAGKYAFPQIAPGTYKVTASGQGFATAAVSDVRLLVSTPATLHLTLEVGAITQTVNVSGEGTQVNTQDASLGNALGTRPILQLPLEGRNVVGLLSLQPGVTFLGENSASSRSGSVNGGKSDQANVTLDGVDVNDQQNRPAFTSVLRVTLDSVQEFRVITSNANAEFGRSSGAQINLVTKSGTNALHGSMYEFHRNTLTTANSFLSNAATPRVERPKLIRNVFGASVGGPVVKNKAFYFLNYEGRRDASELGAQRTVPTAEFRQGIVQYQRTDNSIARLSAERVREIDPLGIGANAEVLKAFQTYPLPNNTSSGDGLNTAGYRFIAPVGVRWNTYLARFDFSPSASGRHNLFLRGNLQNDHSNTLPQFPNQPPNSVDLANSKGMAAGYNLLLRSNLIASLRYGFTRQGVENSGTQVASAVQFFTLSDPVGLTTAFTRLTPVHNPSQDFTWTRGAHNIQFGAVQRFVRNRRVNYERAFHSAQTRASRLEGSGAALDLPDLNRNARDNYRSQMVDLLGIISTANANYNYDLQGNVQALGTPVDRTFGGEEYEFYGQDTWRATRSLTFTAGLRYSLMPPIYETNGVLVSLTPSLGDWFNQRGGLAQQGLPQSRTTPIRYVPKGHPEARDLYAYHKKNFAPRFAVAWSPQSSDGVGKWLFGGPGKTSIRAGWGMFYELFGQSLINRADAGGLGLSTQIQTAGSQFNERTAPRFTGVFNLPAGLIPAAPRQQFPIEAPFSFARGSNIDSGIVPPYTMNLNFSVGREFGRGLFVQASYVGRLSRRSLIQSDVATPANLVDPRSGMDYFEAARRLAEYQVANTPAAAVPAIAYWENLWPGAAGRGLTATQGVYQRYVARAPDYATALEDIDFRCNPSCSVLGPYAIYDRQFASFTAWRSIVGGSYHAMQWTVQQRMKNVEFAFNYTLSKSMDQGSRAESDGTGATFGFLTNPWNPGLHKAVSDYDMTHQWNVFGVVELPVGKGQRWMNRGGVADALLGGWQLSGIYRQSTGLPIGVRNGRAWPTNWQWQGFATQTAAVENTGSHKNAPSVVGNGGPNIFADPNVALNAFQYTLPGGIGNRNSVRGDGIFTIDSNLAKSFRMPYAESHRLQIRWEVFNVTNSVRFDVGSLSLDIGSRGTFGRYSGLLTQPRVMQFGARYEF